MTNREETIRLLMVGRTGNGKSSTGNTIFNSKVFKTHEPNRASKEAVEFHCGRVGGTSWGVTVRLVDGTCVGDAVSDLSGGKEALLESLRSIWCHEPEFHAILFVLKYGVRFTKQEKDAVQCVKSMFGEDVFRKWGVIVMTYGDNFETDNDERKSFEDWCREQSGDFKSLCEECDYRCVLFNNRSYSDDHWFYLRSAISKIQSPPYTKFNFNQCSDSRSNYFKNIGYSRENSPIPSESSPLLPGHRSASIDLTTSHEENSKVTHQTQRNCIQCRESKWFTLWIWAFLLAAILCLAFLAYMFRNWKECKHYFCH
ncbi:unnamed protein product [Lymnaea stagnalis]|uniref:AIG1-type G domain-containing protein n=1 Tax=Lymnaea stagnalis TaxID=6523 RepID=A0AAV2HMG3_LYMST